ncbi:MAG: GTPase [archaeon]
MNLQNLQKINNDKFYFDIALKQSQKKRLKRLPRDNVKRLKSIEIEKIRDFTKILNSNLIIMEKAFPSSEDLDKFYFELIDNNIGIDNLKNVIGKIKGTILLINNLKNQHIQKIRGSTNKSGIIQGKKAFLGRIKSVLHKIKGDLENLENIRLNLRKLPTIKTNITTICIAGYPNVGKSTLLKHLTTAKPEINVYPFTTKRILMGYINKDLQIIDTPGTFRDKKNMNLIEKQAYLAIKHLAKTIVFVIDLTESCGYTTNLQEELISNLKKEFKNKTIIIYGSKSDLMNEEQLKKYQNKNIIFDAKKLKKILLEK